MIGHGQALATLTGKPSSSARTRERLTAADGYGFNNAWASLKRWASGWRGRRQEIPHHWHVATLVLPGGRNVNATGWTSIACSRLVPVVTHDPWSHSPSGKQ